LLVALLREPAERVHERPLALGLVDSRLLE
jgi:hypothetical protein